MVEENPHLKEHTKRIIEALLFASNTPLSLTRIREIVLPLHPLSPTDLLACIQDLNHHYKQEKHAFEIHEIAEGFILRTNEDLREFVAELYRDKKGERLTQAAREVLAVIAFKQPITKPQIEAIRGTDSSHIVQQLIEKELVETAGQLEAPGRPTLYAVTEKFLHHFGLRNLNELTVAAVE